VNRWELLYDYVADYWPETVGKSNPASREYGMEIGRNDLERLSKLGFRVLRVSARLFWAMPMHKTYYSDPARWWEGFDKMLDDCDELGIRLILLLNHHQGLFPDLGHESHQTFYRDPLSASRKLHDLYIREIVTRYADRETVYFWEVTNELNLNENLGFMDPEGKNNRGLLHGAEHLVTYPIVRSASNHVTTEDSIEYLRSTAELIRSLDDKHLIGSGHSEPRPAAMHLWRAQQTHGKGDWTEDSPEETAEYIRVTNPDPIDLISLHCYGADSKKLALYAKICSEIGKPMYIGETGPPGGDYVLLEQLEWIRQTLKSVRQLDIPITLFWTWNDPGHPPYMEPGRTDEAIRIISEAALGRESGE